VASSPWAQIEHIVVLMLENRSFDTMLGALYPYSASFEGLNLAKGTNTNTSSVTGTVYTASNTSSSANPFVTPAVDPGESYLDMVLQQYDTTSPTSAVPTMSGFIDDYMQTGTPPLSPPLPVWPPLPRRLQGLAAVASDIMYYYTSSGTSPQLSVTGALAQAFGVSDAWFGCTPMQTWPNRMFAACSTSGGCVNNGDYFNSANTFPATYPSIFQLLDGSGPPSPANWKVYYHDATALSFLSAYVSNIAAEYASGSCVTNFDTTDSGAQSVTPTFYADVNGKTLPKFSLIEPRYGTMTGQIPNSSHPPYDVRWGETLLANVYNTLRGSPTYWGNTLLIVTYDEHGGCYDHVIPPAATPPGLTDLPYTSAVPPFGFARFGPRVPAVLIAPFVAKGSVIRPPGFAYVQGNPTSTTNGVIPFDHTSIIASVIEWLDATTAYDGPSHLSARDAAAPTLASALTLTAPNLNNGPSSVPLPSIPEDAEPPPEGDPVVRDAIAAFRQKRGMSG
jgi:phospholipase C